MTKCHSETFRWGKTGMKHFGVNFVKIAPEDDAAINEFVRKKAERS